MSFRKCSHFLFNRNTLKKSELKFVKTRSFEKGSENDLINRVDLLSQDESKALWHKINQTLQIIH